MSHPRRCVVASVLIAGSAAAPGAFAQPQFDEVSRTSMDTDVKSLSVAPDDSVMLRACRTGSEHGPGRHRPYHARIGALGRHDGVDGMWLPQRHVGTGAPYDVVALHSGCSGYMLVQVEKDSVASNQAAGVRPLGEEEADGDEESSQRCDCERCVGARQERERKRLEEDKEAEEEGVRSHSLLLWPILVYEGSGAGSEGTSFFVEFVEDQQKQVRLMRVMLLPDERGGGEVWVQASGNLQPRTQAEAEIVWLRKPFEWVEVQYDGRGGVDIGAVQSTRGGAFGRLARKAREHHLKRPPETWEPGCWRP